MSFNNYPYMPAYICCNCPYKAEEQYIRQTQYTEYDEQGIKKIGDKEIKYDKSQQRILPLLVAPLLIAGAARPAYYGPPPYFRPRPYYRPRPYFGRPPFYRPRPYFWPRPYY